MYRWKDGEVNKGEDKVEDENKDKVKGRETVRSKRPEKRIPLNRAATFATLASISTRYVISILQRSVL